MTADEAKKFGLIDSVVEKESSAQIKFFKFNLLLD